MKVNKYKNKLKDDKLLPFLLKYNMPNQLNLQKVIFNELILSFFIYIMWFSNIKSIYLADGLKNVLSGNLALTYSAYQMLKIHLYNLIIILSSIT